MRGLREIHAKMQAILASQKEGGERRERWMKGPLSLMSDGGNEYS